MMRAKMTRRTRGLVIAGALSAVFPGAAGSAARAADPADSGRTVLAYDRVPTSFGEANNDDIAFSVHLALRRRGADGHNLHGPRRRDHPR